MTLRGTILLLILAGSLASSAEWLHGGVTAADAVCTLDAVGSGDS